MATKRKTQQARVLGGFVLDGVEYNPNDVIESHPKIIKSLGSSVDTAEEAVEYCLKLKKPIIKKHDWIEPVSSDDSDQDDNTGDDSGEQKGLPDQTAPTNN